MSVKTIDRANILRTALKANGTFSAISGLALAAASRPIAAFMGFDQPLILVVIGVVLLLFAADLWWTATRPTINARKGISVVVMDGIWIIASIILLATGIAQFSSAGRWLILIVADLVAVFALWQGYGIWVMKR